MSVQPLVSGVANLFGQLRPQSHLLMFEQRGVGVNTPNLSCSVAPAFASVQPSVFKAQAEECLAQYKAQGIHLADFNTRANADDVASLVKSLGYEQANLYGMSYGSRVAQEVVRRHPALVRSVILDGVLDPAESWASAQTKYMVQTLTRFGQACVAAGQCKEADLPDRNQRDADLIDSLGLTFPAYSAGQEEYLPLTGDFFLSYVHNLAYTAHGMLYFDQQLGKIEQRDVETLSGLPWDARNLWSGLNMGAFFAFACQDNAIDAASIEAAHAGLLPVFKRRGDLYKNLAGMCAEAGLTPAPDALTPIGGNVPMLLISGRYDAITPPELASGSRRVFPIPNTSFLKMAGMSMARGRTAEHSPYCIS